VLLIGRWMWQIVNYQAQLPHKKRGRYSGWVEGARKLPRDSRESPSYLTTIMYNYNRNCQV